MDPARGEGGLCAAQGDAPGGHGRHQEPDAASYRETTARFILVFSAIVTLFAVVISVGVVYNNARIALSERTWELASLRVLGFTRGEVSACCSANWRWRS